MKWFDKKEIGNEYIIIAGCGRLGANLANTVSESGGDVVVIDRYKDSFRKLGQSFGGLTMEADATDLDTLVEAGIDKATAVVSVTDSDNINIMVAQLAKEWFHKSKVICRLYDPERECVYRELNIDTICPAVLSAKEIEKIIGKAGEAG